MYYDYSNMNQSIEKIFDEYKIIFKSKQDYINIQIQKNNHLNVFESKFNLKYLHKYKLLMGNLSIDEMIEFMNELIDSKRIKIEEYENNLKLILISTIKSYPNVELILNEKNIIEKLINEIEGMKNENKLLKKNYEEIREKIELIEEENKKINFKIQLIEKKQQDKLNKYYKSENENNKNFELIKMKIKLSNDLIKMIKSLSQSNDNKNTKIDLSKQLLNCNKNKIDEIIFNSNKTNIIDMKEEIFKKIFPTFSQDLIIFSSNSVFSNKYPNDYQYILSIYNSTEHRNLNFFFKNMKHSKNIIYTFTPILEKLIEIEVENEVYGIINNDTIYNKIIKNNYFEKIIEESIELFINSNRYNILIFQIKMNNCENINYIHFLYETYLIQEI